MTGRRPGSDEGSGDDPYDELADAALQAMIDRQRRDDAAGERRREHWLSRQAAEEARVAAEQQIAIANRALALKNAEIKAETDAASAQAAAAGPLAQADRDQAILTEQEKVAVRQAALKER